MKKTLLLTGSLVVLLASSWAMAIPPAINIPETLRESKLLTTGRQQVNDRIEWWKKSLMTAKTDEEIQRACEKLLDDYQLYPNPSYQGEFAEESFKQFKDVLTGKAFQAADDSAAKEDPLVTLKRLNAALVLTKMDQPDMLPALEILVADSNEGLRFVGWQGYLASRKNLLNSNAKTLAPMLSAVQKTLAEETNPILLSAVYRVMNLGTIEGNTDPKRKQAADAAFISALQTSWPARCKQARAIPVENEHLLPSLQLAVQAIGSIGVDAIAAEPKDAKTLTQCLQMIFDLASGVAQTYDTAFADQTKNTALLEQCSALLVDCETAMNALSDANHTFLADTTDLKKDQPDRGAAVLEAVLVKWAEVLKDKGVKESAPAK